MKKIYILAAAALALASCDNNDNPAESSGAAKITATIGESTLSRAVDDKWSAGDCIGILSTIGIENPNEGPYVNLKYTTYDGKGTFEGSSIFFYKPMTLIAYYPFTGKPGTDPGSIEANTGPDNQTETNQPKIDFLWDSKTGINQQDFSVDNPYVNFKFAHKMSKLSFSFQSSEPVYEDEEKKIKLYDGVDVSTMISYEIEGLGIKGTFNTSTGVCALDPDTERDGLEMTFEKEPEKEDKYTYVRSFDPLIVFPQTKPESKNFILHVTTDESIDDQAWTKQKYKCTLVFSDNEIKPGCHYKFKIQVTKRGLIVGNLTIEPWKKEQDDRFIIATVDGEKEPEEQKPQAENQ